MQSLQQIGCELVQFPSEKDQTDSHLALVWAVDAGFRDIQVLLQTSGRLDHILGTIWASASCVERGATVGFIDEGFEATLAHGPAGVDVLPDQPLILSLIPIGGRAQGITLSGFKYALSNDSLSLAESRGISNQTTGKPAHIEVREGWLLVTAIGENRARVENGLGAL